MVPTGVAVAIPEGHAGLVLPRSGLASRSGLTLSNAPGLIDAGYRGEVICAVVNLDRETPVRIAKGDRIAQLVDRRDPRGQAHLGRAADRHRPRRRRVRVDRPVVSVVVREATASDAEQVLVVEREAFGGSEEAEIVRAVQDLEGSFGLVAEDDGVVVGHVQLSRAWIGSDPVLALGPIGVLPARQGQGIGSALVRGGARRGPGTPRDRGDPPREPGVLSAVRLRLRREPSDCGTRSPACRRTASWWRRRTSWWRRSRTAPPRWPVEYGGIRRSGSRLKGAPTRASLDEHADVAQLVEHHLAKVGVAGSNPVVRSTFYLWKRGWPRCQGWRRGLPSTPPVLPLGHEARPRVVERLARVWNDTAWAITISAAEVALFGVLVFLADGSLPFRESWSLASPPKPSPLWDIRHHGAHLGRQSALGDGWA